MWDIRGVEAMYMWQNIEGNELTYVKVESHVR